VSTNAQKGPDAPHDPTVAGLKVRPVLAMVLYALLLASAIFALWAQRTATAPPAVTQAAPWVFLTFAVGFAAYRLALVLARRYSAFKAFWQISLSALFFMLLLLSGQHPTGPVDHVDVGALLTYRDPQVRAVAAEVVGRRGDEAHARAVLRLLEDPDPTVRHAAHDALVRLNDGVDLGPAEDASARQAWGSAFQ